MSLNDKILKVALVGNPSVGKSTLFSRLTGIGVLISNYPGTTVEIAHGRVMHDNIVIDLSDLPGIYSLDTMNMEEQTVLNFLKEEQPDVILNVIDSTRLERNLYLTLEVLELGIPVIVALNMVDEAGSIGLSVDAGKLSAILGAPVIAVSAQKGIGLEELMHSFARARHAGGQRLTRYDRHIESFIKQLTSMDRSLSRYDAIVLLSRNNESVEKYHEEIRTKASFMRQEIEKSHGAPILEIMAANRYGDAGLIAKSIMNIRPSSELTLKERIDNLLIGPVSGFMILVLVILTMLLTVFFIGGLLEDLIVNCFDRLILSPVAGSLAAHPLVQVVVEYTLIGVQAGLGIVVPYIMTFYVIMAVLENTGYLTRAAFLLDDVMHKLRLHGRAMIPLILSLGCNVPAIMSTKSLQTRRERIITSTLVCMIPCSARSIVILGLVASFVSIWAALSIYMLMLAITIMVGYVLGRTVRGEETGFVLEMVPLRVPDISDVAGKTWMQMKEFIYVAFPLLIAGSTVLGVLQYSGILDMMNALLSPVTVGVLGLPAYTATALIFGIMRKEMALETLAVMAGTASFNTVMTGLQMYVFAVFTTIYMPCLATITMLGRVVGWKDTALITMLTLVLALAISGLIAHMVPVALALI